jgi:orotate phosphoribosyltransferase
MPERVSKVARDEQSVIDFFGSARRIRMTPLSRKESEAVDAEVREKIHLEILKRTGAYHSNDHILLPSGHHATEYIDKTLVTTEPSFTEGLGAVIAKHFAQWPVDCVLSTGPGALILSHCVARAHPSRPVVVYGIKGVVSGKRKVSLPAEFHRLIREGTKVLIVEDLVSSGSTLKLLIQLVERLGGQVAGIGCLWRRTSQADVAGKPVFSLVSRDFPTYTSEACPLCKRGAPLNEEFVKRREERKPSSAQEHKS